MSRRSRRRRSRNARLSERAMTTIEPRVTRDDEATPEETS